MTLASNLISIITPAYQAQEFIARAVSSVISQTYTQWEMLIISDDLQDYQAILAQQGIEDPRLRFFSTGQVAAGVNTSRSIALSQADGEWITTLDADDSFMPKRLKKLLPIAQKYNMAGDNVSVVNHSNGELIRTLFPEQASHSLLWLDAEQYCQTNIPMTFLFHRSLVTLPWQSDVELGEDTLFNLRLMQEVGVLVPITSKCLHRYYVHNRSLCHSPDSAIRAERGYTHSLKRLQSDGMGFNTPDYQRIVLKMLSEKQAFNRFYLQQLEQGFKGSFQEFAYQHSIESILLRPDLEQAETQPQMANS
ncbi:glycosyltransferase family 2 protein [Echinimonas agarilytica]|uniref:Glycosyltransferase n=1 Tax=Echinimonas agarilytica TaxID=1215918 RepID=A0AA41W6V9_9GAMM|nr:glycosyltransferase family 2 protein [Echinimonas agarilytica]MCM2680075.1 glycosyltransferase [Echinimonas agarilytica]